MSDTTVDPEIDQAEIDRRAKAAEVTAEMIAKWQREHPKCHQAYACFTMGCYYAAPKCRRKNSA